MSTATLRQDTRAATRARYLEAAVRYAQANVSDPFALARAQCHIGMGMCDPDFDGKGNVREGFYDALMHWETRTLPPSPDHPKGQEYQAVAWSRIRRL